MLLLIMLSMIVFAVPVALRVLARTVTFIIAVTVVFRAERVARAIYALANDRSGRLDFDRRPSRKEGRRAANGLRLAVRQTELASLFPDTFTIARRFGSTLSTAAGHRS